MLVRRDIEAGVFSDVLFPFEPSRRIPLKPAVVNVNLLFLFSAPKGICVTEPLSPSVDVIAIDSRVLVRRTINQTSAPIKARTTIPTTVNVPATFPVLLQKLSGMAVPFTVVTCV